MAYKTRPAYPVRKHPDRGPEQPLQSWNRAQRELVHWCSFMLCAVKASWSFKELCRLPTGLSATASFVYDNQTNVSALMCCWFIVMHHQRTKGDFSHGCRNIVCPLDPIQYIHPHVERKRKWRVFFSERLPDNMQPYPENREQWKLNVKLREKTEIYFNLMKYLYLYLLRWLSLIFKGIKRIVKSVILLLIACFYSK